MRAAHVRYRKLNTYLKSMFGEKVHTVGIYGGFTCPNLDGSRGRGGCTFCNQAASEPLHHAPEMTVTEQLAAGSEYIRWRLGAEKFLAYFQDYTSTYGELERLRGLYREALAFPGVVGLSLSTRPDCLGDGVLDLLEETARDAFLWVELGVQSAHDRTLALVNRCHTAAETRSAVRRLRGRGLTVSGHVILGLPGESPEDMMATADFLAETGVDAVKIHNLHVVKHTRMANLHHRGGVRTLELEEYAGLAVRFLERLPPRVVIQRTSGEAPRRLTVAPAWSVNKLAVINAVDAELERRDTWQGKALGAPLEAVTAPLEPAPAAH